MSVIEVPVQMRPGDLLRAIERLSPTEFSVVASRVMDLQRLHETPPDLLAQAQRKLPLAKQHRLESLAAKSEAETIDEAERAELLALSTEAEQLDADRAEALLLLAQQRGVTLGQLRAELNPPQR